MQIRTWVIKVADKNALERLMRLVNKGELEELFLCQVNTDGAVNEQYKKDDVLAILSSKGVKVQSSLKRIAKTFLLDDLSDEMFDIDEDGAELKGVSYPGSEEEEIILVEGLK